MKKTLITLLGIVLCGAAVAVEKPAGATMEQYVDALMRRMTLEEKIGRSTRQASLRESQERSL